MWMRAVLCALLFCVLSACSGGSDSTPAASTPPSQPPPSEQPPPQAGPWPVTDLTLYAAAQSLTGTIIDASPDQAQNIWAVTPDALYVLRLGQTMFTRYSAADGLHVQTYRTRQRASKRSAISPPQPAAMPTKSSSATEGMRKPSRLRRPRPVANQMPISAILAGTSDRPTR
jgi:hypothetical protein